MREKRTKRSPAERVKALLIKNKALTEKEVLEQVKGTSRKEIRALRVSLGIDRQSAIADARGRLAKEPGLPAGRLISDILATYGVRLGPPDVSRLRPVKAKTGRRPKGSLAAAFAAIPPRPDIVGGIKFPTAKVAQEVRYQIVLGRIERLEARVKKLEGGKR
jgi:hypothetical protein